MKLNEAIRASRIKKGMNQTELAKKAGLTQAYISMLENGGKRKPNLEKVQKISEALGIPLPFLMLYALEDGDVDLGKQKILNDIKPLIVKLLMK
ncbi:MAG: hypothetical protein Roseis2KO_26260 [Roseivirga sp.]